MIPFIEKSALTIYLFFWHFV